MPIKKGPNNSFRSYDKRTGRYCKMNFNEMLELHLQTKPKYHRLNDEVFDQKNEFLYNRIRKLKDLEAAEADGSWEKLPKKEVIQLKKLQLKLSKNLEGIKEMRKVPNAVIVVDPVVEHNAILESRKLNIPVFAICDTNADPDNINHVIPGNDDATKAIQLIVGVLSDAIVEAKGGLTAIAYTKDEGEEATMKDAVRQADRENALRLAARREMQRERMEREKARREALEAKFKARKAQKDAPKAEETTSEPVVEAKPAEEVKATEETKPAKKTTKKADAEVKEEKPVKKTTKKAAKTEEAATKEAE